MTPFLKWWFSYLDWYISILSMDSFVTGNRVDYWKELDERRWDGKISE
jgi:hypothetical protein